MRRNCPRACCTLRHNQASYCSGSRCCPASHSHLVVTRCRWIVGRHFVNLLRNRRIRQSHPIRHSRPKYFPLIRRCRPSHCRPNRRSQNQALPEPLLLSCDPLPDGEPLWEPDGEPDEPLPNELLSPDNELPDELPDGELLDNDQLEDSDSLTDENDLLEP